MISWYEAGGDGGGFFSSLFFWKEGGGGGYEKLIRSSKYLYLIMDLLEAMGAFQSSTNLARDPRYLAHSQSAANCISGERLGWGERGG